MMFAVPFRITFLLLVAGLQLCAISGWLNQAHTAEPVIDFKSQIQPIFERHCIDCHGPEEQNGGLRLDASSNAFAEADSGMRAVVAGQPDQSELLVRIRSASESDQMPPEGERLKPDEIERLTRWISSGAEWHSELDDSSDEPELEHWAFQPIQNPRIPEVADADWEKNPIDPFIARRWKEHGLQPVSDASPRAFIRRVTYDLTGLPPTREEVLDFVGHVERDGYEVAASGLIDELLGRESYGERWGRHWMDWVRYADTAGDNSDFPIPEAYLYRNYIIDSINEDVPYDRFLIEQLAGDLLPAETPEQHNRQTIATGYLAMARRFGSLVERYPWHLTIEDTIDNVGRTMMGLTLACARCHDHKFDPISTRDYYGLYGIFASTRYPFPGIELFQTQRDFVPLVSDDEVESAWGPHQQKTNELTAKLNRILDECRQMAEQNAKAEKHASVKEQRKRSDDLDRKLGKARNAGNQLADHLKSLPELPSAYAVADAEPTDAAIQIKGEPTRPGAIVPRGFPEALGGEQLDPKSVETSSGRLQLARWIASPENPMTARVVVNRVWQRHFGEGLVASTSDFGLRGQTPSHPELLDWLATDLIQHGWSLKHLHRRILNSRTYRLSSDDSAENLVVDPNNRFHWKFNRHRLDAESLRDTLLLLAGSLDASPANEPHPFPEKKKWAFTQHHPFKDEYDSNRRSVYLMVKRLTAKPYFQTFDGPDPNVCTSNRDQSITALQALYFVNDEFLHQQADRFARRLPEGTDEQRIEFAFETVLGRSPVKVEQEWMAELLASVRNEMQSQDDFEQLAWSSVTRCLFRLNEFLYVD